MGPTLKNLFVFSIDPEPEDSHPTRLKKERNKLTTIKIIVAARKLETLGLIYTTWKGAPEDARWTGSSKDGNKPLATATGFKKIVPSLACIPKVDAGFQIAAVPWRKGAERLYSQVENAAMGKGRLEVSDVQSLGIEASLDSDHELHFFAEWLQEEELAGELASRWNERYS